MLFIKSEWIKIRTSKTINLPPTSQKKKKKVPKYTALRLETATAIIVPETERELQNKQIVADDE